MVLAVVVVAVVTRGAGAAIAGAMGATSSVVAGGAAVAGTVAASIGTAATLAISYFGCNAYYFY